jgi:hypothetical protein
MRLSLGNLKENGLLSFECLINAIIILIYLYYLYFLNYFLTLWPQAESKSILFLEDLLTGPQVLGVTYEFWENLVYRYLKDPNFHDKVIWNKIYEGPGRLSLDRFTEREVIYLTLTNVLKKEEIKFYTNVERIISTIMRSATGIWTFLFRLDNSSSHMDTKG